MKLLKVLSICFLYMSTYSCRIVGLEMSLQVTELSLGSGKWAPCNHRIIEYQLGRDLNDHLV